MQKDSSDEECGSERDMLRCPMNDPDLYRTMTALVIRVKCVGGSLGINKPFNLKGFTGKIAPQQQSGEKDHQCAIHD